MSRTAFSAQISQRRRGGFTLIEVMVVIGIILVLIAVSIAGISQVAKHAKVQRTQTALESARSVFAGYVALDKNQSQLKALYSTSSPVAALLPGMTGSDLNTTAPALDPQLGTLVAAKGVNGQTKWSLITDPNTRKAIDFTALAMKIILKSPENQDILGKLPAESKFVLLDDNGVPLAGVPVLLADGNGEPILFIPPAGLSNVTVSGGGAAGIVQADARLHPTSGVDPSPNITRTPFFASAGSDRDFTTGDDNAYSVHQ